MQGLGLITIRQTGNLLIEVKESLSQSDDNPSNIPELQSKGLSQRVFGTTMNEKCVKRIQLKSKKLINQLSIK